MSITETLTLIGLVASGIAGLIYFLTANIKTTLDRAVDDMMKKLDIFVKELQEVKEAIAVKSTMLDYMSREIESIKRQCWQCHRENKTKEK